MDAAGELAVPGPGDVGWYRFGPAPGEPGTAVLAAHVAFDGVDGVFRHLADLEPGAAVIVRMDDGTDLRYRVAELATVPKEALPAEVWSKDSPSRLALVTCGGSFDRSRRSYDRERDRLGRAGVTDAISASTRPPNEPAYTT